MADNPYVNKVEYDGQTLMDLTGDTVTPSDVLSGVSFHDRSGAAQQGSLITHNVYDGLDSTSTSDALSANQGKALDSSIKQLEKKMMTGSVSNATKNFTISNSSRTILILTGLANNRCGIYFVGTSSGGTVTIIDYKLASDVTVSSGSANTLTVSTTTTISYALIVCAGSVS